MQVRTFSIVVGTSACNSHCKFCVSHTTGMDELPKTPAINTINFAKAIEFAKRGDSSTCLFTGKGEPTLFPAEITKYLQLLQEAGNPFPFLELQTNAIQIGDIARSWYIAKNIEVMFCQNIRDMKTGIVSEDPETLECAIASLYGYLRKTGGMKDNLVPLFMELIRWRRLGLNTIAISTVGVVPLWNKNTYLHHRKVEYPDLATTVIFLRELGFTVRLCVMMQQGMVDSPPEVEETIDWCRKQDVGQLTIRPIRKPSNNLVVLGSDPFTDYINKYGLTESQESRIRDWFKNNPDVTAERPIMFGNHQAIIYDVKGQNCCVSDCLTVDDETEDIRTLIFYSDGRLTTSWTLKGAVLLQGSAAT